MPDALYSLPGIRQVTRKTTWYRWHCPIRGCKKAFEYTVPRFTERQALRHLQAHQNRKKKIEAYKQTVKDIASTAKQVTADLERDGIRQ
jgi:hypothetical protein